ELGPDLVCLGTAKVAGVAAVCDFGGRSFWLMMIETEVAAIKRIGSERRSDVYPFVEILRQGQIAGGGILGQLTGLYLRAAARERLYEEGRCDRTAHNQRGYGQKFSAHRCSPIALVRHRNPQRGAAKSGSGGNQFEARARHFSGRVFVCFAGLRSRLMASQRVFRQLQLGRPARSPAAKTHRKIAGCTL